MLSFLPHLLIKLLLISVWTHGYLFCPVNYNPCVNLLELPWEKVSGTKWLKQHECIFLHFWRLAVWDQGIRRAGSLWASLLDLQMVVISVCLHLPLRNYVLMPSYKDASHIRLVPTPMSLFFLNFLQGEKNIYFFNWRIIALQCYVGFCHTAVWFSHKYTYVPSLLNLFPILLSHLFL